MPEETTMSRWYGIVCALGAALLFGATTPLSKLLLGSVDPLLLAGILYLGAGFGLLLIQGIRAGLGLPANEASLKRGDLPWLAAVVVFGGVAGPLLLMLGLIHTGASSASLLLNLESIATMIIAWVVFRENVDRSLMMGAIAIVAGAAVLSWGGTGLRMNWGGLLIAGACLSWGIDNNLTRKLSSADPVQIAAIKGIAAGAVNTCLAFSLGAGMPDGGFIAAGAAVGFLGIGVSLVLFMLGLRHLGTARTGAYFSFAPFVGAILSVAMLGDAVSVQLMASAILMAIGLRLHLSERHEHEHVHVALEHEHRHVHDAHHQHADEGAVAEPHAHWHRHDVMRHKHPHYPDLHHRHGHP